MGLGRLPKPWLSRSLPVLLRRILRPRWREAALGVIAAFVLGLGAGPALGGTLTTTSAPLSGSVFQGGDGDRLNAPLHNPPLIDWQGLQADGRVVRTADPNSADGVFGGFEGACAGRLELDDAEQRRKSERGEFHRHLPGGGPRAASRRRCVCVSGVGAGGGAAAHGLWSWSSIRTRGCGAIRQGTRVPCRKTGDILISFLEHGQSVSVQADRWVTNAGATDPATGCATSGTLDPASGLASNTEVQGSWNGSDIDNFLPVSLLAATGFTVTDTIAATDFGEAAINLTKWLSDLGNPCGVVASTWAHSRASDTFRPTWRTMSHPARFGCRRRVRR